MKIYPIKSFFNYYRKAQTIYNVQSSFLYSLILNVLDEQKEYYVFSHLEYARKKLLKNETELNVNDLGAGSHVLTSSKRRVSDIAATSLSSENTCRILFQLVEYFKPKQILELGTSLGISSMYLAAPSKNIQVTTIEGDKEIAKIAKNIHKEFHFDSIKVNNGSFKEMLPKILNDLKTIDFVFIDGHHDESTIEYFKLILSHSHDNTIIVLDDIYWSETMTKVWQTIIDHPRVSLALDIYKIGIVFLNKDLSKQHFRYIPFKFKPWMIGLFG